ncbi:MAG: sigma-70 family RNA polymerase sigma factor [Candidatus Omnitrophota bacterium]
MQLIKHRIFKDTRELIAGCVAGQASAWDEFTRYYTPLVDRAIRERFGRHFHPFTREDVEDTRQAFYAKLWQKKLLSPVADSHLIDHWIVMVAANFATDTCRKAKNDALKNHLSFFEDMADREMLVRLSEYNTDISGDTRATTDIILLQDIVERHMERLTPIEKIIMRLHIFCGMKHHEIADTLNIPLGTATSVTARARKKIISRIRRTHRVHEK